MGAYQDRLDRFNKRPEWKQAMRSALGTVHATPRTILDLGCGVGALVRMMSTKWPHAAIRGSDIDPESIKKAKSRCSSLSMTSFYEESVVRGVYDLITCMFVIGHTEDPHEVMLDLLSAMSPGSSLLIAIPNQRFDNWMRPWNWVSGYKDDPTLQHRWTPEQFTRYLEAYRLRVEDIQYHGDNVKWLPYTPNSLKSWVFFRAVKP